MDLDMFNSTAIDGKPGKKIVDATCPANNIVKSTAIGACFFTCVWGIIFYKIYYI